MRHKLQGLFPGTFHSNLQRRTPLPVRLCCPSNKIWYRRNAAALWPIPARTAFNPQLMVTYHSQGLRAVKDTSPQNCAEVGNG